FATDCFLRFWSPRSPSPFLTTVVALVRWSAAKERPTSSLSLNWPPLLRRTNLLSPLCGSISSRATSLSYENSGCEAGHWLKSATSSRAGKLASFSLYVQAQITCDDYDHDHHTDD